MSFVTGLKCTLCGRVYSTRVPYTCPRCGITGILDVQYDYPAAARVLTRRVLGKRSGWTQWRYRELLPIGAGAKLPAIPVGYTPVTCSPALAKHLGAGTMYLKDDGRNPSGSLKDRSSAIAVVKARERRQKVVACASTGNAASSLAGMAASMGLRSIIFVPERTPEPKLMQLLIFGATVIRVRAGYDDAWLLCQQASDRHGWYNRNCAVNPYLIEGKKTAGLEICEQFDWRPPGWVAVSIGDGCTVAGVWKGFYEMKRLGLIEQLPRMLGVQAEGAGPVAAAFHSGRTPEPVAPATIADSIAVGVPHNWKKAIDAVHESRGTMLTVSDAEILDAMDYTGRLAGVFAEPAAATAVAGVRRAVAEGIIGRRASVLGVITGNGLKDVRAARSVSAVKEPFEVAPDGAGLDEIVERHGLA